MSEGWSLTLQELSDLFDLMRAKGVASLVDGDVQIVLGPPPPPAMPARIAEATEPAEPPIGPDGKPMSAQDRVLFASSLGSGEDEEIVPG